jgi:hypothetical protein
MLQQLQLKQSSMVLYGEWFLMALFAPTLSIFRNSVNAVELGPHSFTQ